MSIGVTPSRSGSFMGSSATRTPVLLLGSARVMNALGKGKRHAPPADKRLQPGSTSMGRGTSSPQPESQGARARATIAAAWRTLMNFSPYPSAESKSTLMAEGHGGAELDRIHPGDRERAA